MPLFRERPPWAFTGAADGHARGHKARKAMRGNGIAHPFALHSGWSVGLPDESGIKRFSAGHPWARSDRLFPSYPSL